MERPLRYLPVNRIKRKETTAKKKMNPVLYDKLAFTCRKTNFRISV